MNDFDETFDGVEHAGLGGAFEGDGADFGHAVVVEDAGAGPELLEAGAGGGNAAAGFARDDDGAHGGGVKVDVLGGGHFGEANRVGGRAAEHIRLMINYGA